jgi:fructose-1,6-bisphosphatase
MAAYVASVKAKEPPHSLRYIGSMVGAYTRPLLTST